MNRHNRTIGRRSSALFESLESRQLFNAIVVSPGGSIQTAVNSAHSGDTIRIKAGTYVGQVIIPSTDNNLTITSTGPGTVTIEAPAVLTDANAIIHDAGAHGLEISNVTVAGPASGLKYGILVDGGGSAEIDWVHVTHVQDTTLALDASAGIGIGVTNGYASINNVTVDNYERAGIRIGPVENSVGVPITIPGAKQSADIYNVHVTGVGPTSVFLQNGIDFDNGASGTVTSAIVTGNVYSSKNLESTGFIAFDSRKVYVSIITSYNNDEDIAIDAGKNLYGGSNGVTVVGALTYGATYDGIGIFDGAKGVSVLFAVSHNNGLDGIYLDPSSSNETVAFSVFYKNGLYDAEDDSYSITIPVKSSNAGTLDQWFANSIGTSNDPNLLNNGFW